MKKTVSTFLTLAMVLSLFGMQLVSADEATVTTTTALEEVYTELYRMDFDDIDATDGYVSDLTAFNAAYGSSAKLVTNDASGMTYEIATRTDGGSDKFISLDAASSGYASAIHIQLPNGGINANNGTYKISYEAKAPVETYRSFLKLKTSHMTDEALAEEGTAVYNWGPMLGGIAPIDDSGAAVREATAYYATYSTWDYTANNGPESAWNFTESFDNENKVLLTDNVWHKFDVKIDTINRAAHYYCDGEYIGSQTGDTFAGKYILDLNAKSIQLQSVQSYQGWYGYSIDNIIISHSDSAVAYPELSLKNAAVYNELYRMDFDKMAVKAHSEDGTALDTSAFTTAYSGADIYTTVSASSSYEIGTKTEGGSDKYLELKVLTTAVSGTGGSMAINIPVPDGGIKADNGIYKISYDVNWLSSASGNKPFLRIKTYHYAPTANNGIDPWGPVLSAIGPISNKEDVETHNAENPDDLWTEGTINQAASKVYGTFGTETGVSSNAPFASSFATNNIVNLAGDTWHNVEIVIDTNNKTADYYYDGIYAGTQKDSTFLANVVKATYIQLQMTQWYQAWNGYRLDNITISKAVDSTASISTKGFESVSAIDLSADSKKLTFASDSYIGAITSAIVVDGSNGAKLANTVSTTANEVTVDLESALSANGLYTVYLMGEENVITGKLILGTGVETEVAEQNAKLELASLNITDGGDDVIAAGETVTAKAIMRNATGAEQAAYLIIAVYNNGQLTQVDYKPISSADSVFSDTISLTVESAEKVKASAFVWTNLEDIEPMGASDSI